MTSFFKSIDYHSGHITSAEEDLTSEDPVEQQIDILREDLMQVEYPDNYVIDVGWDPSFDLNGTFRILVIKDGDWENPVYAHHTTNLNDLRKLLENAVSLIESKL